MPAGEEGLLLSFRREGRVGRGRRGRWGKAAVIRRAPGG